MNKLILSFVLFFSLVSCANEISEVPSCTKDSDCVLAEDGGCCCSEVVVHSS